MYSASIETVPGKSTKVADCSCLAVLDESFQIPATVLSCLEKETKMIP